LFCKFCHLPFKLLHPLFQDAVAGFELLPKNINIFSCCGYKFFRRRPNVASLTWVL
jgi:hypothetical protein